MQIAYVLVSISAVIFIFYQFSQFDRSVGQTPMFMLTIGVLLLVLIPKLLIGFFMLFEDFFRIILGTKNYFVNYDNDAGFLPERRLFVSRVALGIAAIPFLSLISLKS